MHSRKFQNSYACSKKLIRIISCVPFKAHPQPLMFARKILSLTDINLYMSGIFVYQCLKCNTRKYSMTSFKETMMYIVIIREKTIVYMSRIQGMIFGNFAAKYMTLIFGTILVRNSPSLDVFKQRLWHLSRWFVSRQLTAYVVLYTLFGGRRNCIWRLIVLCCPSRRISEQSSYSIWRSYCTKHTFF